MSLQEKNSKFMNDSTFSPTTTPPVATRCRKILLSASLIIILFCSVLFFKQQEQALVHENPTLREEGLHGLESPKLSQTDHLDSVKQYANDNTVVEAATESLTSGQVEEILESAEEGKSEQQNPGSYPYLQRPSIHPEASSTSLHPLQKRTGSLSAVISCREPGGISVHDLCKDCRCNMPQHIALKAGDAFQLERSLKQPSTFLGIPNFGSCYTQSRLEACISYGCRCIVTTHPWVRKLFKPKPDHHPINIGRNGEASGSAIN